MIAIGVTLSLLERHAEAEAMLVKALETSRRTSGENHPQVFNAMRELGIVLLRRGRCEEAEPLLAEALPGLDAAFPGDSWETSTARVHLGACRAQHDPVEGERLLRSGYERLVQTHGHGARLTLQARELLTSLLREQGREADAVAIERGAAL
jgi:hypothetical protein